MNPPWLLRTPQMAPRLRLICFAYAGGNARMYGAWQKKLGPQVEVCAVQLPGRGARRSEPPFTSLDDLIAALADVLCPHDAIPFAFFGHSLGALIAFELSRHFARHQLRMPERLIMSAANAPSRRSPPRGLHQMGDDALIEELKRFDGTPPAVMKYRELLAMALPVIRADFMMSETYRYRSAPLLPVPISVMAGIGDPLTSREQIAAWAELTSASCDMHWFEGGHFFINEQADAVLDWINEYVRGATD